MALGSFGAFLVVESVKRASARDASPLARLVDVVTSRDDRERTSVDQSLGRLWKRLEARVTGGGFAVLSGAIGTEPATSQELAFLKSFGKTPVRATGTFVGHGFESQFFMNVALAALVASRGQFNYQADGFGMEWKPGSPIENVLVTGTGHRRGEGLALLERIRHAWSTPIMVMMDDKGRPGVAVTGIGLITALGVGKASATGRDWRKVIPASSHQALRYRRAPHHNCRYRRYRCQ